MSEQNVREEIEKWNREKALRKQVRSLNQQITDLTTQMSELRQFLTVSTNSESNDNPVSQTSEPEVPEVPPPLTIDTEPEPQSERRTWFQRQLAQGREKQQARKQKRQARQKPKAEEKPSKSTADRNSPSL
jgi:hypothetical protein